MTPPVVLYHDHCVDGFAAAWCARTYFGDRAEYIPVNYNQPPPELRERHVFILDFSYPLADLVKLAIVNHAVIVLDHHKTAQQALKDLPPVVPLAEFTERTRTGFPLPLMVEFDMDRSGAGMAWDYFNSGDEMPDLIKAVQDRDLWKFDLRGTRAIHAALTSYAFDFEVWDWLMRKSSSQTGLEDLIIEGTAIDRRHMALVKEVVASTKRRMVIGGHDVPVCNANYNFASDIGNVLCVGEPFGATYVDHKGGRSFSLRSTDNGVDVSVVAKKFGGGGHRNASGFLAAAGWEGDTQGSPSGDTRPA